MLYSGSHDELADPDDVQTLITTLEGIVQNVYWKEVRKYAHLDFGKFFEKIRYIFLISCCSLKPGHWML